ncbi:DUF924 family protein [Aeromonas diversa]|uniref:DUF924 family protein n=1 Tax=Aeromonas diversa TaxID=502790 RepID=UPI003463056C
MEPWNTLLDTWFGEPANAATLAQRQASLWWGKDEEVDRQLRLQFGTLQRQAAEGELDDWCWQPKSCLALLLLLDQLPRNTCRGQPGSFAQDGRAQQLCLEGLAHGHDTHLLPIERLFFYLPLEHAESLELQDLSVALFERLFEHHPHAPFGDYLDFARRHRDIIARFGRFPHRNAILGRESSESELAFLGEPGSSF